MKFIKIKLVKILDDIPEVNNLVNELETANEELKDIIKNSEKHLN